MCQALLAFKLGFSIINFFFLQMCQKLVNVLGVWIVKCPKGREIFLSIEASHTPCLWLLSGGIIWGKF